MLALAGDACHDPWYFFELRIKFEAEVPSLIECERGLGERTLSPGRWAANMLSALRVAGDTHKRIHATFEKLDKSQAFKLRVER